MTTKTKTIAKDYDASKYLTMKEALEYSGYGNVYLRMTLIKKNKVEHVRELKPGTQIPRILVVKESLDAYMSGHPRRSKELTPEEMIVDLESKGYVVTKS